MESTDTTVPTATNWSKLFLSLLLATVILSLVGSLFLNAILWQQRLKLQISLSASEENDLHCDVVMEQLVAENARFKHEVSVLKADNARLQAALYLRTQEREVLMRQLESNSVAQSTVINK